VKSRGHHLREDGLFECYLTVQSGEILDPPVAEHLTDCEACAARYAELTQFMEALSAEATAETDEIFTTDRLRAQRQQITRKIEHLGHPARVISFPSRAGSHHAGSSAPRPVRRWIAAAAAAGLFVGVGTGLFLDWERAPGRHTAGVIARQTVLTATEGREGRIAGQIEISLPDRSAEDKAFLSELELAGERPRIRELSAVDALTPHVREINLR
jgi:hypothetical protein